MVVRFAGDSGDGIQLTGNQFTSTSAVAGNDLATLPDFPAEIRAPAGTLPGVSGFQMSFSSFDIHTAGDEPDVLVAFNPAALKMNLRDLKRGSMLIVNEDSFSKPNLQKAGYDSNPLEDGSLDGYRTFVIPITTLNRKALQDLKLSSRDADRCKNFFVLGLLYHLYNRSDDVTLRWLEKHLKRADLVDANKTALKAGRAYGEATEAFQVTYKVEPAPFEPGVYRNVMGNSALALGLVAASMRSGRPLFFSGYPITPASTVLHELSRYKEYGVVTVQAEDEIAAMGACVGAAFGGALSVTASSGPGLALKAEAMGLGVMVELPMIICNVQRAGPSTGMPTKVEQADLLQALWGRHGEAPAAVVSASSPGDCFDAAIEAARIALKYMIPVILLSDGYLANASEPWKLPDEASLPDLTVKMLTEAPEGTFHPYERDPETLARPWAVPGTAGLEHRIGGLEKQDGTGDVSYDPDNHQKMVELRQEKIRRIARGLPPTEIDGPDSGRLIVLGWGSTRGPIAGAVRRKREEGKQVSWVHLRHLNPLPDDLETILGRFDKVLIPEMNLGQLEKLVRMNYLIEPVGLHKVKGKPFLSGEIAEKIDELLEA
ncbi:MAG TPA: 2-oxoacid:acceptor oxidoreductase subunit alpha [Candidatus Saccharimonadales bacterium]|nr:2-oxoacid:acceptor oxidoreductase subunit alpha [Candidatus Saccharimonadales bacterium]